LRPTPTGEETGGTVSAPARAFLGETCDGLFAGSPTLWATLRVMAPLSTMPPGEVKLSDAHQRPSLERAQVHPGGGAARRLPGSRAGRLDAVAGRLLARVGNAPKKFVAPFAVLP